jgi:hypothetical protein
MRVAFLTEMGFRGRIPTNHTNMRTEFSWMCALNADHYNILEYPVVKDYDWVMIIFPKGGVSLNSEGIRLNNEPNRYAQLYTQPVVETLKKHNKKVAYVQEGPCWFTNDFSLPDQFNFFNQLADCDAIFTHNLIDINWYQGLFPDKLVTNIPTLLIEELIQTISPVTENKTIIGGNFCRWYGGFQSYLIASDFGNPIWVQTSHCSQPGEEQIMNILPRLIWIDWMKSLSTFKYAVHLMPTRAAGTFSLNCAYFGIPCIGNEEVDTQILCFPRTSVMPEDVLNARENARCLKDEGFYKEVSELAKEKYKKHYSIDVWKNKMLNVLNDNL